LALRDARDAIRLEPGAASPRLQTAQVLEAQGDLAGAAASARRATVGEPSNWATWLVLSPIEAEAGNARAATATFELARSLNPLSPLCAHLREATRNPINR